MELLTILGNFGLVGTAASLAVAAFNWRLSAKTNRAKFWLDLRAAFQKHDEAHRKLRPGGAWANSAGPNNVDDYAQIEAYMGLFEHCEIMLKQKLIDQATFDKIYRYRLANLVANDWVRTEKLIRRSKDWSEFIDLLRRMKIKYE